MASLPVDGVMSSIDVSPAFPRRFSVRKCPTVLDYGGSSMVHHRVSLKRQPRVHGHVKLVGNVRVPVVSLWILTQLSAKVNRRQKRFSCHHCAPAPVDHPALVVLFQADRHRLRMVSERALSITCPRILSSSQFHC